MYMEHHCTTYATSTHLVPNGVIHPDLVVNHTSSHLNYVLQCLVYLGKIPTPIINQIWRFVLISIY